MAKYSIRSSEEQNENQLIEDIKKIVEDFNKQYEGLAKAEFIAKSKMKAFEKSGDETIQNILQPFCATNEHIRPNHIIFDKTTKEETSKS